MERLKAKFNAWLKTKSGQWCKAAGIRALKTVLCAAIGLIPAGATISAVDFRLMIGMALCAGVASIITSLAGLPEIKDKSMPWWKAALIRCIKTFGQVAAPLIPASVVISAVDWKTILSTAALACLASILISMKTGLPEVDNEEKGAE